MKRLAPATDWLICAGLVTSVGVPVDHDTYTDPVATPLRSTAPSAARAGLLRSKASHSSQRTYARAAEGKVGIAAALLR